jgi:hypothetical protein
LVVKYGEENTNKESLTTIIIKDMQNPNHYMKYIKAGDTVSLKVNGEIINATVITLLKNNTLRLDKIPTPVKLSDIDSI